MKKIFLIIAYLVIGYVSQAQVNSVKGAKFEFKEGTTHDFGTEITAGSELHCVFTFKNVGDEKLIITNVSASTGKAVPEYPKEPILPGKTGEIKITYYPSYAGLFMKTIFIMSNAPSNNNSDRYELYIKGGKNP